MSYNPALYQPNATNPITSTAFVDIPRPCCINLSVKNTSTIPINLQNANLVITRVA